MNVWCLSRDQSAHFRPLQAGMGASAEFIYDSGWDPVHLTRAKPDIVLCVNDYPFDISRCLDAARESGIPSLVLQDGILEWRCQFENPLFGAGGGAPQHQPVLADKIACIGHESLRRIAAWGNENKVELTGAPRLDELCLRQPSEPEAQGHRLLVMTAKNPGFTSAQREITLRSLRDLKAHLDGSPHLQVFWRLSKWVADELQVPNQLREVGSADLVSAVEQVDAVISTPSTAMIEAMLLGRPVAALDYHNVPTFLRTAWAISAKDHIAKVVGEVLNPEPSRIAFQQESLADNLVCDGTSVQRVIALMRKMVEFAKTTDLQHCPMPMDLLGTQSHYTFLPPGKLSQLYRTQHVFQDAEPEHLKVRLARAENENRRLKVENAGLKRRVQLGAWIKHRVRRMVSATALL